MLDESFYISMEGIQLYEATLVYTGEDGNVTLVRGECEQMTGREKSFYRSFCL